MSYPPRHQTLAAVTFTLWLLIALSPAIAQQDFTKVAVELHPVSGHVYMLTGAGGNIGVSAGPDGIAIIDDQFAPLAERIQTKLTPLAPGPVKFIINTHWHGDHTGGNEFFGDQGILIAHDNVRTRLRTAQNVRGRQIPPKPPVAWPIITLQSTLTLHFNDEDIHLMHYPHAHTDGDTVVVFPSAGVYHLGDLFFEGRFPFVDLDTGGSISGLIEAIKSILKEMPDDAKIIPGHGRLATRHDLERYFNMLTETADIVRQRMAQGRTMDQVVEEGLPEKWTGWAWSFVSVPRWIETIYKSFAAPQLNSIKPSDRHHQT